MKARILFHCAAVVALVLILAATPSNATERRDPPIVQDATPAQASSPAAHTTSSGKKRALKNASKHTGANPSVKKNPTGSGQNAGTGSGPAAK